MEGLPQSSACQPAESPRPPVRRLAPSRRLFLLKIGVALTSVTLSLVLAEVIARVWKGVGLDFSTNFLAQELDLLHKRVEYTHDPELGWVLLPKFQGPMFGSNGGSLTVLANGFRSNGS